MCLTKLALVFVLQLWWVPPQSTGALKPEDIVIAALDALRAKMETLRRKCREMAESGVVASSGPAGGPAFASGAGVGSDSSSVPSLGSGSSW